MYCICGQTQRIDADADENDEGLFKLPRAERPLTGLKAGAFLDRVAKMQKWMEQDESTDILAMTTRTAALACVHRGLSGPTLLDGVAPSDARRWSSDAAVVALLVRKI